MKRELPPYSVSNNVEQTTGLKFVHNSFQTRVSSTCKGRCWFGTERQHALGRGISTIQHVKWPHKVHGMVAVSIKCCNAISFWGFHKFLSFTENKCNENEQR